MSGNLALSVLGGSARLGCKTALIVPGRLSLSHADLLAEVERAAGALSALGFSAGDRVLMRLGNEAAFPVVFLACAAAGLVPVPTSAQLTKSEIQGMSDRVGARLVVASDGIAVPDGPRMVGAADLCGAPLAIDDWVMGDPDRLGYIVFTSGSGGAPKAVAHAHRAIAARRMMWRDWYDLRPEDAVMHAGAFNWTYTLGTGLMDPWAAGATAIVPEAGTDAADLPDILADAKGTIFAAAPGIYRRMLRRDWPATPHLRHGLSAGERLQPTLRQAWQDATGTDLHEALGMSECSTFISGSPRRPAPEGSSGYPQDGRRIRVGEDGQLYVSADDPGLMLGYLEDGVPVPIDGAWFRTGDLVEQAGDGAITHLGRVDDVLNPGGHRVAPQEVEAALAGLPVTELAIGQRRVDSGATVLVAYYVGDALDEAAANAYAATRLARYKQPRIWARRDTLPRNPNGKLIRKALR